jgi:hypothetical protein
MFISGRRSLPGCGEAQDEQRAAVLVISNLYCFYLLDVLHLQEFNISIHSGFIGRRRKIPERWGEG